MNTLWILEDEESQKFIYSETLAEQYRLKFFDKITDLDSALATNEAPQCSLLIADLKLDDGNFLDYLQTEEGHEKVRMPFLVVSALDQEEMLRSCFGEGALDYLVKPYSKSVLKIKVSQQLEKNGSQSKTPGGVEISREYMTVKKTGNPVASFTPTEFRIFMSLYDAKNQTSTRSEIESRAWGSITVSVKSLDVHIFNIRRKLKCLNADIVFKKPNQFTLLLDKNLSIEER